MTEDDKPSVIIASPEALAENQRKLNLHSQARRVWHAGLPALYPQIKTKPKKD